MGTIDPDWERVVSDLMLRIKQYGLRYEAALLKYSKDRAKAGTAETCESARASCDILAQ